MWLQFTRRTYCQIPFISNPKTHSKVRLLSMIKNKEIFLVQLATSPVPKHYYRSLQTFLNSTLTRNEFESFQTQTQEKVPNHVSNLSRPKLHKYILLYKNRHFSIRNLTSLIQPKTCIHTKPYSNSIHPYFHTNIHSSILKFHISLPVISFFLLFFSLLLLLLPFSSLLSYPFLLYLSLRPK